jgi:preprotein translocase subunit YajC
MSSMPVIAGLALVFQQGGGGSAIYQLLPILAFFFILYFFLLRPQIKQQRAHQKLVDNLKKGDKVITSGGVWGDVDAVEAGAVLLKINDKTKIKVNRSAISGFQPEPKAETDKGAKK